MDAMSNFADISAVSAVLRLEGVTLARGGHTVFEGLSLTFSSDARRIGIVGDNGAGKSSLFRLICGLDRPQAGQVRIGTLAADASAAQRAAAVGMMFQNPDEQIIFPTVVEELALGLSPRGVPRKQALVQARALLAQRGLGHWADRAISSLSHGQRQHVCWLSLLIAAPSLVLLDEPFASLDLPGQALLAQDIARASQTVVVATHILAPLHGFDRVIWLDHGRVRADGPAAQVCAAYEADVALRLASHGLQRDAHG